MKKIEAIIRPRKLDAVRAALADIDLKGMTISNVNGLGRQEGYTELYRSLEYQVDFLKKIKLDIVVDEEQYEPCIRAITEAARTGQIGDGKIFVSNIERVIRIRTGEEDEEAM